MQRNGSPVPIFDTDEGRTYFLVRLLIHPALLEPPEQAHDEAPVEAPVELNESERRILLALAGGEKGKVALLDELGLKSLSGGLKKALDRLKERGLIELTIPDKPNSSKQKRRLTRLRERVVHRLPRQHLPNQAPTRRMQRRQETGGCFSS